jgi:phosphate transport system permease protein
MKRARLEERLFVALMLLSAIIIAGSLSLILLTVILRGLPALTWEMITRPPEGGFYLGEGGGILNAILGSLYLAIGGTLIALCLALPIAIFLRVYGRRSRLAEIIRLAMDVLWGIPSIVYGAVAFTFMLWVGMKASLLGGILALAMLELPILTRGMDEALGSVPDSLKEASLSIGATRLETTLHVVLRQAGPSLITAILLAFGRGIGDAASVLFTAGYTDHLPTSLLRPVASLPLAVFFQLATPYPVVQERAYTSALVLTILIFLISTLSRRLGRGLLKHQIR